MGRAHHSHYLVWCELGRTTLMRELGLSYAELEGRGLRLPVSHAELEYRRGIGYDEEVRVETRVEAVRSRSLSFGYRIVREHDGALAAEARTTLVCTDEGGRPRRLPPEVREILARDAGADPGPDGALS